MNSFKKISPFRKKRKVISSWSNEDKQNFADRNFLKSKKITFI